MPDYRKLRVYVLAARLSTEVHRIMPLLPGRKAPGLTAQLCRSAQSVAANIVEGASRDTQASFGTFLVTARASADETAAHLRLAGSLDWRHAARARELEAQAHIVAAMLNRLIRRVSENAARAELTARKQR